jgi:hypothetical protein
MKLFRIMISFTKGIRGSMVLLSLMMTVSMLAGVIVVSQIRYIRRNYDLISHTTGDPDRLFYFMQNDFMMTDAKNREWIASLEEDPAVAGVYPVYTVNPLTYGTGADETMISIVLYHHRLEELFPGLRLDYSKRSGILAATPVLDNVKVGESITLRFTRPNVKQEFLLVGKLEYPYSRLTFGGSATVPTVNQMYYSDSYLMMEGTPENLEMLSMLASVMPSMNFILEVRSDATDADREALMLRLSRSGITVSLPELLKTSEEEIWRQYRTLLPKPLFLLVVSIFGYFSTLILTFRKKERDLALYYLCGANRSQCIAVVLAGFVLMALIPTAVCVTMILILPVCDWLGWMTAFQYRVDHWCGILIGGTLAFSAGIAGITARLQMKDHTPVTLLRGVEQ